MEPYTPKPSPDNPIQRHAAVVISFFSTLVVVMVLLHDSAAFLVVTLALAASHAGTPSSFNHSTETCLRVVHGI